jgi:uncharacterized protein (TIGR02246 family)
MTMFLIIVLTLCGMPAVGQTSYPKSAGVTADTDEAAVRGLFARLLDTYNRGDARATAAMFTEDGDLISGTGDHLVGHAQIEKFLANLVATLAKGTKFIGQVTSVRFAGSDVAVLTADGGWLYPGDSSISEKNRGLQTMVAFRRGGRWHVVHFQRTRIAPPPAAPTK